MTQDPFKTKREQRKLDRHNMGDLSMFYRRFSNKISQHDFEDETSFEQYKIDLRASLEYILEKGSDIYYKNKDCCHEQYEQPTYTHQRQLFGNYEYVYERKCKNCGYFETKQVAKVEDKPSWAIGAGKVYYNNHI